MAGQGGAGWRRKHDDPNGPPYVSESALRGRYHTDTLQDVVRIVTEANADGNPFVRACGSHWSLSEAVCDPDYRGRIVETHGLNRTLYNVIPSCLSAPVLADLRRQPPQVAGTWDEEAYTLYHVEAGIRIHDLYARLDGQDARWAASTDVLAAPGLEGPWAMSTLAAAGGQTLAGAISTSTHGSDLALPPLADAVQAIHLVAAGGHQFWIERAKFSPQIPMPMCRRTVLEAVLRRAGDDRVTVIQDDAALDAVLVSIGRMGILYAVVLKVVRAYGLEETRRRHNWEAIQPLLRDPNSLLFSQRHLHIVLNPLPTRAGNRHSCWVTRRRAMPLPQPLPAGWEGRRRRAMPRAVGANPPIDKHPHTLYARLCAAPSLASILAPAALISLLAGIGAWLLWRRRGVALGLTLLAAVMAGTAARGYRGSIGAVIGAAWNMLVANGHCWLLAELVEALLAADQVEFPEGLPLQDISYAILDRHNYADRLCVTDGDALEVAFDGSTDLALRFIAESVFVRTRQLLDGALTGTPMTCATYVSVRFTGRTRALLGIQRWDRTCLIAVAGLKSFSGIGPLLDVLEADALAMGGTVHWGQRNKLTREQVEACYSDLPIWRAVLRQVSAFGNPLTFSTAYTRRTGLEP